MRPLYALALVAALALPRAAHAQTPSVTPTPAPVQLEVRFDCGTVPWSCGDGPTDVRWQLYEVVGCNGTGQEGCRYELVGPVLPGMSVTMWPGHRYKIFLAANLDRSGRINRLCATSANPIAPYLSIYSQCAINDTACAGPENWNLYARTGAGLVHRHKHIGDCTRLYVEPAVSTTWVLAWGLPGELAAAPTTAATATATMTAPPASPTATPTVGTPTEVPTTAAPTATDEPTATRSATATATATATPTRPALLLPMLGR